MTLREELEILRGEPIQVWEGDPKGIPCIETSDPELLCKHPVVSVSMITYNHEPYIREAIEGVMMQKADFEFELVIGEDCSTDKTREICFEYQKKYPDKIRVLWWHKNSYQFPHPAGGNSHRNLAHCRGEFIALCEGDDYWIDPLKLQKQVDVMRKYPNVGLCFGNGNFFNQQMREKAPWSGSDAYHSGVITGISFFHIYLLGKNPGIGCRAEGFVITASVMLRRNVLNVAKEKYEIFSWKLLLSDKTMWLAVSSLSDVYYLPDKVADYRVTKTGAMGVWGDNIYRDSSVVKLFFAIVCSALIAWPVPFALVGSPFERLLGAWRGGRMIYWPNVRQVYQRFHRDGIFTFRGFSLPMYLRWLMFLYLGAIRQFDIPRRFV